MSSNVGHWIDGGIAEGTSGRIGDVTNPATGDVSSVPLGGPDEGRRNLLLRTLDKLGLGFDS